MTRISGVSSCELMQDRAQLIHGDTRTDVKNKVSNLPTQPSDIGLTTRIPRSFGTFNMTSAWLGRRIKRSRPVSKYAKRNGHNSPSTSSLPKPRLNRTTTTLPDGRRCGGDLELAEQKHKELEGDGRLREEQHQAKLVRLADGAREDYAKIKRLKAEVKVLTTKGSGDTATSSDQVIRTQQPIHVSTGMAQKTPGSAIKPSDPRADAQKDHDGRRADAWEGRQGVTAATIRKFRTVPLVDWGTTSSGVKADKGKGRAI